VRGAREGHLEGSGPLLVCRTLRCPRGVTADLACSIPCSLPIGKMTTLRCLRKKKHLGVWNTDSSGNFVSNTAAMSGTSSTLESFETSFHQDLNGDGVIGVPAVSGTVIEAFGSTSLVQVGTNFYLNGNSSGSGPELKYGGAAFVAGQAGAWTPIGAEQTATGYEVAWKVAGADQYSVWIPTAMASTSQMRSALFRELALR